MKRANGRRVQYFLQNEMGGSTFTVFSNEFKTVFPKSGNKLKAKKVWLSRLRMPRTTKRTTT